MDRIIFRRAALGLLCIALGGIVQSCTRVVDEPVPTQSTNYDVEDEALMNIIEAIPSSNYKLEDMTLPDGELVVDYLKRRDPAFLDKQRNGGRLPASTNGPQDSKKMLISRMSAVAHRLCNRTKVYPKGRLDTEPAQLGLAYSWGQRDYINRAFPPGDGSQCTMYSVYGLDCSGLIYNLLKESGYDPGIKKDNDVKHIIKPGYFETLFKADPNLSKIKVKDLGTIPYEQFQPGDFIYWLDTKTKAPAHIGVVLLDKSGQRAIFQSNGTHLTSNHCETNVGSGRGCRQVPISAVTWKNGFGIYGGVVRIITDITGKWEMQLKCDWAAPTNIAASFDIEFNMSENNDAVTGKGTGTDYDGKKLNIEFKGSYDQANNVLKGRFYITVPGDSGVRQDDMTISLKDDTGFQTLTSITRGSDTCEGEVRLINKTSPSSPSGRVAARETTRLTRQNFF